MVSTFQLACSSHRQETACTSYFFKNYFTTDSSIPYLSDTPVVYNIEPVYLVPIFVHIFPVNRMDTLTRQYSELEDEFRLALQMDAERFREVRHQNAQSFSQ